MMLRTVAGAYPGGGRAHILDPKIKQTVVILLKIEFCEGSNSD